MKEQEKYTKIEFPLFYSNLQDNQIRENIYSICKRNNV